MNRKRFFPCAVVLVAIAFAGLLAASGCTEEQPLAPETPAPGDLEGLDLATGGHSPAIPSELVTVSVAGAEITFWPYVGALLGEASDPVSLVFTGKVHPVQIRAALLALDGDRSDYGIPNVYPFNGTWHDAMGDLQGAYVDGAGWSGSVVQLQCGDYDPMRFHLRLWQTGVPGVDGAAWTLGTAHFDLMIPGTADHQVLSWEVPELLVVVDLMRTGLLNAPPTPTEIINAYPSWRTIDPRIYNEIPDELKVALGLPPGQVTDPVPIPSDGKGTILSVAGEAPITPDVIVDTMEKTYEIVSPKPFCNDGDDYVLITGPVHFEKIVEVTAEGRLGSRYQYHGALTITPWDPVNNEPLGDPYPAEVGGRQTAWTMAGSCMSNVSDSRRSHPPGGTESLRTAFLASMPGNDWTYYSTSCLENLP